MSIIETRSIFEPKYYKCVYCKHLFKYGPGDKLYIIEPFEFVQDLVWPMGYTSCPKCSQAVRLQIWKDIEKEKENAN